MISYIWEQVEATGELYTLVYVPHVRYVTLQID